MGIKGHEDVTIDIKGAGPRFFTSLHRKISRVRWLDNHEELKFSQDPELEVLCINATGYAYGDNLVVRVAEVE